MTGQSKRDWLRPLLAELLTDAEDDWIPVDNLLSVAHDYGETPGGDWHKVAVDLLHELLTQDLMAIGDLGETGFESWSLPPEEAIARFKEDCERYNWQPQGALWWLACKSPK